MPWIKIREWCNSTSCPGIEPTFSLFNSSSFSFISDRADLIYGTGKMSGKFAYD